MKKQSKTTENVRFEDRRTPPFVYVDLALWEHRLKPHDYATYLYIAKCSRGHNRGCFSKLRTMVEILNSSIGSIKRSLSRLLDLNLIEKELNPGKATTYHLTDPSEWGKGENSDQDPPPSNPDQYDPPNEKEQPTQINMIHHPDQYDPGTQINMIHHHIYRKELDQLELDQLELEKKEKEKKEKFFDFFGEIVPAPKAAQPALGDRPSEPETSQEDLETSKSTPSLPEQTNSLSVQTENLVKENHSASALTKKSTGKAKRITDPEILARHGMGGNKKAEIARRAMNSKMLFDPYDGNLEKEKELKNRISDFLEFASAHYRKLNFKGHWLAIQLQKLQDRIRHRNFYKDDDALIRTFLEQPLVVEVVKDPSSERFDDSWDGSIFDNCWDNKGLGLNHGY